MALESGDALTVSQTNGNEARSALSDEYVQMANIPRDDGVGNCSDCSIVDTKAIKPEAETEATSQLSPQIEEMKRQYPVIGELFEEYGALVNDGKPQDYLEAEPRFRKAVEDSDQSHTELEKSIGARLKEFGPGLPGMIKDYTEANEAVDAALKDLPVDEQRRIIRNMQLKQIPLSEAAGQNKALAEAATRVETIFKENTPTLLKLTEMQAELANSVAQKQYAREMHGDTLLYGAPAAEPAQSKAMLEEKARIDREVQEINRSGVPNILDYIKDQP